MLKFSVNLSFFYLDMPFLDRFTAAAKSGFKAVEYLSPYEEEAESVREALDDNSLVQALFNSPSGDWNGGERGLLVLEKRDSEFADAIDKAVDYAVVLNCPRVNVLAGINKTREPVEKTEARLVERLQYAADVFAKHDLTALLEHINPIDMPGYFVGTPGYAIALLNRVGRPNAKLQYDVYHASRTVGELTTFLREHFNQIGHIQIADNPDRHQPGTGEINYAFFLRELDRLGYQGWVGLEYKPYPTPDESLGWIKAMGFAL